MTETTPKVRHDGWTPARRTAFLEALAESACVKTAADAVGMSTTSAYRLRARADKAFVGAWEAALDMAGIELEQSAMRRAIHGATVPIYSEGKVVGERTVHNEALVMFLLRVRGPRPYIKLAPDERWAGAEPDYAATWAGTIAEQEPEGEGGTPTAQPSPTSQENCATR